MSEAVELEQISAIVHTSWQNILQIEFEFTLRVQSNQSMFKLSYIHISWFHSVHQCTISSKWSIISMNTQYVSYYNVTRHWSLFLYSEKIICICLDFFESNSFAGRVTFWATLTLRHRWGPDKNLYLSCNKHISICR